MGYVYAAIGLFAGLCKGFCGKKASVSANDTLSGLKISLLRMALCFLIGSCVLLFRWNPAILPLSSATVGICVLSGLCTATYIVTWLFAVRDSSYMFLSTFLMLGSVLAVFLSGIIFHEALRRAQWASMGILFLGVWIMSIYNKKTTGKLSLKGWILLIVCGVASGMNEFSRKVYMSIDGVSAEFFNTAAFFFAALFMLVVFAILTVMQKKKATDISMKAHTAVITKKMFCLIFLMSICLYANNFFTTLASGLLTSAQLYPPLRAADLILSSIMAWIFFRQKVTVVSCVGIFLAILSIVLPYIF